MDTRINQIIDELITIDPEFGKHRDELEKVLLSALALKPDISVDLDFVRRLRIQLLEKVESKHSGLIFNFKEFFMKKAFFPQRP
jgi:hypothetical protein